MAKSEPVSSRSGGSSTGSLIVGSTLALLIGATIMILLHETSHSVAGALLGYLPTQVPFAVGYTPEPPPNAEAIAAFTGPIFSLVSGLVGFAIDVAVKPFRSCPFWRLVWLWTIFLSIQEAVGYFVIVGILPAGDTAVAFAAWGVPVWGYILATVLGIGAMFANGWLFSRPVIAMTTSMKERYALAFWPWIAGTIGFGVLMTLYVLITPGVDEAAVIAVLAAVPGVAVFAPISFMFGTNRFEGSAPIQLKRPIAGVVVLVVLVVVNLVLTRGWLWG